MDHTPFITGAYAITVVVLAWCAVAPWLRGRKLARLLAGRARTRERGHAS